MSEQLNEMNKTIHQKTDFDIDFDILHNLDLLKKNQKSDKLISAIEDLKMILHDLEYGETQANHPFNNKIHQNTRQEIDPYVVKNLT